MLIENSVIHFHPQCHFETLALSDLQGQYLADLRSQRSILEIAERYLEMGWLLNFGEMYRLIEILAVNNWILNPEVKDYFKINKSALSQVKNTQVKVALKEQVDLKKYSFFRSLGDDLIQYFLSESELFEAAAESVLCQVGDTDRHLFVLLSGEACIYKKNEDGYLQYIAHLKEGSVFGEMSFFLGTPRSAQIVTTKTSQFLKIKYNKSVLDPFMNLDKNKAIIYRFWVQQALNNSDFFKNVPSDCLDQVTFSGEIVKIKENMILFKQDDPATEAYVIVQGQVGVFQNGLKINVMNQGYLIGEVALMNSGGLRTATVIAERETLLLRIKNKDFFNLMFRNLALAKEVQRLAHLRREQDLLRHKK